MKIVIPEEVKLEKVLRWENGVVDETKNVAYLREHSIWVNLNPGVSVLLGTVAPLDRYNGRDRRFAMAVAPPGMSSRKAKSEAAKLLGGDSKPALLLTGDHRCSLLAGRNTVLPALAWTNSLDSEDCSASSELQSVVNFWGSVNKSAGKNERRRTVREETKESLDPSKVARACLKAIYDLRVATTSVTHLRVRVEFPNENTSEEILSERLWHIMSGSTRVGSYLIDLAHISPTTNDPLYGKRVTELPEVREVATRYLELVSQWQYDVHWNLLLKENETYSDTLEWDPSVTGRKGYRTKVMRDGRKQVEAFRNLSLQRYIELTQFDVAFTALAISMLIPGKDNTEQLEACFRQAGVLDMGDLFKAGTSRETNLRILESLGGPNLSKLDSVISKLCSVTTSPRIREGLRVVKDFLDEQRGRDKESAWVHNVTNTSDSGLKLRHIRKALEDGFLESVLERDPETSESIALFLATNVEVDGCRRSAEILSSQENLFERAVNQ